ncbi:MAG: ABC transporter substrate-binding protein, partial [Herminiimonas sp.]|nr:ABC transporter substrate-binding protein [Herminiimonas sp.]
MFNKWRVVIAATTLLACAGMALAEEGVSDNTILIGQTVGVTGIVAAPVKEMNEGANAYIALVNKQGGVNGRKIVLRTIDDKFDPALARSNAETLVKQDHVFALFQSRGTPHTEAILPVLIANNVPLVAPSTGATIFHEPVNHLVFNVRAKYQDEVVKAIEHLSTIGITSIGLLHVDDSFGRDGLAGFSRAMAARKLTPVVIQKFDRIAPDYKATAAALIKAKPAALIIVSSSKNTIDVIKEIRTQGSQMQIVTLSNNSSLSFVKDLGKDGIGVVVTQISPAPHLVSSVLGQEFKLAAKASGATISYAAMEGFVNAKVLVEGLRRAGRNLSRESFIRGLESMQRVDLGGVLIT